MSTAGNFKEFVTNSVEVHVSTTTEVNAVMQVGAMSEKVMVQANDTCRSKPLSASVGEVISGTQVRELPLNGENFVGLTQLSPGCQRGSGANFVGKGLQRWRQLFRERQSLHQQSVPGRRREQQ